MANNNKILQDDTYPESCTEWFCRCPEACHNWFCCWDCDLKKHCHNHCDHALAQQCRCTQYALP